jgi:hypothetical protein
MFDVLVFVLTGFPGVVPAGGGTVPAGGGGT